MPFTHLSTSLLLIYIELREIKLVIPSFLFRYYETAFPFWDPSRSSSKLLWREESYVFVKKAPRNALKNLKNNVATYSMKGDSRRLRCQYVYSNCSTYNTRVTRNAKAAR